MFNIEKIEKSHPELKCSECGSCDDLWVIRVLSGFPTHGSLILCRECRENMVREMKLRGAIATDIERYAAMNDSATDCRRYGAEFP